MIRKSKSKRKLKTKGSFFWKSQWFSICSMHYDHTDGCKLCITGSWHNVWLSNIGKVIHKITPSLWIWWMNLSFKKGKHETLNKLK